MPRFVRKLALLAKVETTYGVDATPTGGANAILATNVVFTPMAGSEESRELLLPYLGAQGVILTGEHTIIEFSVELAGSGTAGTAPGFGPLLRGCGMAETINAGDDVEYAPVSAAFEALTLYYNLDGVRHIILGARGNMSLELTPQRIPRMRFRFVGLAGTISDAALPVPTLSAFQAPVVVSKANTTLSLHGYAGPCDAFSMDLGNQVEPRLVINHESVDIGDRNVTGSATVEAALLATKNWFAIAKARTRDALSVVHGTVAGNIAKIDCGAVEIGRPTQGQTQGGIATYQVGLTMVPTTGNDEVVLTFA